MIAADCKNVSSVSPKISQDEDGHYEWAQGDGVPHGVDEIQAMKDLLLKDDKTVKNTMEEKELSRTSLTLQEKIDFEMFLVIGISGRINNQTISVILKNTTLTHLSKSKRSLLRSFSF